MRLEATKLNESPENCLYSGDSHVLQRLRHLAVHRQVLRGFVHVCPHLLVELANDRLVELLRLLRLPRDEQRHAVSADAEVLLAAADAGRIVHQRQDAVQATAGGRARQFRETETGAYPLGNGAFRRGRQCGIVLHAYGTSHLPCGEKGKN